MRSLTSVPYDTGPQWTEVGSLFDASVSPLGSIYWPWLVDTTALPGTYAHRWRLYYSTNHASTGGISLAEADDVAGPWTQRGVIYTDTVEGRQTETPSVMYVPETGLWHLYYQQSGVGLTQSTMLATSGDGIAWTRVGTVITAPISGPWPGDGHCGYMVPHRLPGGRWVAYHLRGGAGFPHFAMSWSRDGLTWQTDPRPLGYTAHLVPDNMRTEWNTSYLVRRGETLWWVGLVSDFTSGTTLHTSRIAQAPIAHDLRTLLAPPLPILPIDLYQTLHVATDADGVTWLIYQLDDEFRLMRGEA